MQRICVLTLITTSLALGSIFSELLNGSRKIILSSFENALLRICFASIVMFIAYRDFIQIMINTSVRYTGATSDFNNCRFIFVESMVRIGVTTLALLTILFTIFSTPCDEFESIIDQTANFTALVILMEIDNILAEVFSKTIEKLDVDLTVHQENIESEFKRAADFVTKRCAHYYIWIWFEVAVVLIFSILLLLVVTFYPIFHISLYFIFKPLEQ